MILQKCSQSLKELLQDVKWSVASASAGECGRDLVFVECSKGSGKTSFDKMTGRIYHVRARATDKS